MRVNNSAIIIHNNKVLIIQRRLDDEYFPGDWGVPGGGMETHDVSIQAGAERETLEEVGLEVIGTNTILQNNYNPKSDALFTKVLAKLKNPKDFDRKLQISEELNDYKWVSIDELEGLKFTPYTKEVLTEALSKGQEQG